MNDFVNQSGFKVRCHLHITLPKGTDAQKAIRVVEETVAPAFDRSSWVCWGDPLISKPNELVLWLEFEPFTTSLGLFYAQLAHLRAALHALCCGDVCAHFSSTDARAEQPLTFSARSESDND